MEYDLIVVGGGPVGLHAALKAAILNHTVLVIDKGASFSRIAQASAIANVPGHPGISGRDLLAMLRRGLDGFARLADRALVTVLDETEAIDAERASNGFRVRVRGRDGAQETHAARALLLATGVVDRKPGIDAFHEKGHETLAPYVHRGALAYCLLCEGWDLADKEVAVIGASEDAVSVAADVKRQFQGRARLFLDGAPLAPHARALARAAGLSVEPGAIASIDDADERLRIAIEGDEARFVDKAIFSLGWYKANNELATLLGARVSAEGLVITDDCSRALGRDGAPIPGLFVAGDLRAGRWKQVVIGWGDAETAIVTAYAEVLPSVQELISNGERIDAPGQRNARHESA